jgi:hypothetical protein
LVKIFSEKNQNFTDIAGHQCSLFFVVVVASQQCCRRCLLYLLLLLLPPPRISLCRKNFSTAYVREKSKMDAALHANTALHLVALRGDSVRGTILRRRPDTSQLSDVWVDGKAEVMQGDVVSVLRINAEGEQGFSYIRIATKNGFAEGFIRSSYLTLRPLGDGVAAVAAVHRGQTSDCASVGSGA